MTNPELKDILQLMLDEGNFDVSTISMLQDASVHVAMKLDLPLDGIALTYGLLAAGHQVMKELLGIDMSKMDVMGGKQPDLPAGLADLLGILDQPTSSHDMEQVVPVSDEERKLLNALLKDLKLD